MKKILKGAVFVAVAGMGLVAVQGKEVARWVFDKTGTSEIVSTNGKFKAQITNKSGKSGVISEGGSHFSTHRGKMRGTT